MIENSVWDYSAADEADFASESGVEPMQRVMQVVTREHWPGESYYVWNELHPEIPSALFVLDTEALLSKSVFAELLEQLRPEIRQTGVRLESVNTHAVTTYGIVTLHLDIQGVRYNHDFWLCDISDSGIIGSVTGSKSSNRFCPRPSDTRRLFFFSVERKQLVGQKSCGIKENGDDSAWS